MKRQPLGDLDRHGPMTVAALPRPRHIRHRSMRVVVGPLDAEGLVVQAPKPADACGHTVAITHAGRASLAL